MKNQSGCTTSWARFCSPNVFLVPEPTGIVFVIVYRINYNFAKNPEVTCFFCLQVYWSYITHMLTNLGTLSLERIHSMLGMFGLQGNLKKVIGLNDLKLFLQKKTIEQRIVFKNGSYSLAQ